MKENQLKVVYATLLMGMALVFSCQKEEVSNLEQGLTLKSASIDCSECVENWSDSKVTQTGWVKFNQPDESVPSTFLDVYNDGTTLYYTVYRTAGTFDEVRVNGAVAISQSSMTTYSWQAPLVEGWKACDKVTVAVEMRGVSGGTGRTAIKSFDYYLRELCQVECEESFTYIVNEDKSYTFTYTPAEDLTDQLVVFTFAQGSYVSGLPVEFEQNGNNGQTYSATLSFKECEPVSWTVNLTPNCSGNSGHSNVWTDFKVNDVSKKGELDNIVLVCQ